MTVESYILVRQTGDGTQQNPYGPRQDDLAPYTSLSWEDVTARAGIPLMQELDPRVLVIRGRMTNQDALAMSTDNKLWMIESRRYSIDENGEETEHDNNRDDVYESAERTLRINQLANVTGFDTAKIEARWTPDKTHREVGIMLRDYLRTLE